MFDAKEFAETEVAGTTTEPADNLLAVDVDDNELRLVLGVDPTASTANELDVMEGVPRSCDPLCSTANELKPCTGSVASPGGTKPCGEPLW